jgi:hypothetical protein
MAKKLTAYEVYESYVAIKLHFSTDRYDYNLYHGQVKSVSQEAFENRKDKAFFYKLSYKYKKNELEDFLVANMLTGKVNWVGVLVKAEADKNYRDYLKTKQSLKYVFEQDLNTLFAQVNEPLDALVIEDGQNPLILKEMYAGNITLETVIILNEILPIEYFSALDSRLKDDILWPETRNRAMKLRAFMKFSKPIMKGILKKFIPLE